MGLDITAYKKLTEKPDAERDEDGCPVDYDNQNVFYQNPDFPEQFAGVKEKVVYAYEDSFGFRAGSYGGYNNWRRQLAQLAGYEVQEAWDGKAEGKPFVELVNFSDCEGVIGPVVSAKLAHDFAAFDEKAKAVRDDYFYERYVEWRAAFEMGAEHGAVSFH